MSLHKSDQRPARSLLHGARRFSGSAIVALTLGATLTVLPVGPAAAAPGPTGCPAAGAWVGAWSAPASDNTQNPPVDPSYDLIGPVDNSTVRSMIVPTRAGQVLRVHLSNAFGQTPLVVGAASVAKRTQAANVDVPVPLTFGGSPSVTVPVGGEVVSDPAPMPFQAFEALAVSTFLPDTVTSPTRHWVARQTSYQTAAGSGNQAFDTSGEMFTADKSGQSMTSRLFVTGMDVLAPDTGAIVALGDSLTDGYQPGLDPTKPGGESAQGLDENVRWPDYLARRVNDRGLPMTVVNAGISGNRVSFDPSVGGQRPADGPSALNRLGRDVLSVPNVRTVVFFEGINDLGQAPGVNLEQITQNYTSIITTLHQRGIRVLQGTITPAGGNTGPGNYGTDATNDLRNQINAWIRTDSPADGVVDFDKAVADPASPKQILPAYDSGDHLHFNAAGYQKLADTVALDQLTNTCSSGSSGSSWGSAA
ncbi:MAG: GDSL family lipase [Gordonia sp.]|nr:GDSL family lipase [Gordonia sp. (in: high G+C Gram-positive bacteria)]